MYTCAGTSTAAEVEAREPGTREPGTPADAVRQGSQPLAITPCFGEVLQRAAAGDDLRQLAEILAAPLCEVPAVAGAVRQACRAHADPEVEAGTLRAGADDVRKRCPRSASFLVEMGQRAVLAGGLRQPHQLQTSRQVEKRKLPQPGFRGRGCLATESQQPYSMLPVAARDAHAPLP